MGLVILNWTLLVDMVYVLFLGSSIWFYTLHELDNFHKAYSEQTPGARIAIQDMVSVHATYLLFTFSTNFQQFKCCGYFNSSDLVEIGGAACPNATSVFET